MFEMFMKIFLEKYLKAVQKKLFPNYLHQKKTKADVPLALFGLVGEVKL